MLYQSNQASRTAEFVSVRDDLEALPRAIPQVGGGWETHQSDQAFPFQAMTKRAIFEAVLLPSLLAARRPLRRRGSSSWNPGIFMRRCCSPRCTRISMSGFPSTRRLVRNCWTISNRIYLFNIRPRNPTRWKLDVHATADPMVEMLKNPPGNVVVLAGWNSGKIDRILASLRAGLNVFADKPWIIHSADLPARRGSRSGGQEGSGGIRHHDRTVRSHFRTAAHSGEHARRIRHPDGRHGGYAGHSRLQHPPDQESRRRHSLRRPAWFFDIAEQGEALADVGTHVVDLVAWTAFPGQAIDYRKDIQLLSARRWPLMLTRAQFREITGEADFPRRSRPRRKAASSHTSATTWSTIRCAEST
jgi:hypothetical protein